MTTLGWITLASLAVITFVLALMLWRVNRIVRTLNRDQQRFAAEVTALQHDVDGLVNQADSFAPLLADTRSALRKAQNERLRADDLIKTATSVTGTVDSATKFAITMISSPFVRVLSFFSGVKRGVRTLARTEQPRHDTRVIEPSRERTITPAPREHRLLSRGRRRR